MEELLRRQEEAVEKFNQKACGLEDGLSVESWEGLSYELGKLKPLYQDAMARTREYKSALKEKKDKDACDEVLKVCRTGYARIREEVEKTIYTRHATPCLDPLAKYAFAEIQGCEANAETLEGCDELGDALQFNVSAVLEELKLWEGKIPPDKTAYYKKSANEMSSEIKRKVALWKEAIRRTQGSPANPKRHNPAPFSPRQPILTETPLEGAAEESNSENSDTAKAELKKECTILMTKLFKQGQNILQRARVMSERELKEALKAFTEKAEKAQRVNDSYEELVLEEEGEDAEEEKADIIKVSNEWINKLTEVEVHAKETLWKRFGARQVLNAVTEAERTAQVINGISPDQIDHACQQGQLSSLESLITGAKKRMAEWDEWSPAGATDDADGRIQELKTCLANIRLDGEAAFSRARREAEEKKRSQENKLAVLQQENLDAQRENMAAQSELIRAKAKAVDEGRPIVTEEAPRGASSGAIPRLRLKLASLPIYSGVKREFYRWQIDWDKLQRQSDPSGSAEVRKFQLLDSIDEKIIKDLRLRSYNTADEVFRVLENRFGNKEVIIMEIIKEVENIPPVKGYQYRKMINLIQTVEKALTDLKDLSAEGNIKNASMAFAIEKKLPEATKKEWAIHKRDPANIVNTDNHFEVLLEFLKKEENILEQLEHWEVKEISEKPGRTERRPERRKPEKKLAFTRATESNNVGSGCSVCGDSAHSGQLFACSKFRNMDWTEKQAAVKKTRTCTRCLFPHGADGECTENYLCTKKKCQEAKSDHHYLLCPSRGTKMKAEDKKERSSSDREKPSSEREKPNGNRGKVKRLTIEQEEVLTKLQLPEDALKALRRAFTNNSTVTSCSLTKRERISEENEVKEYAVLMMMMEVITNAGDRLGTLIDLASDTNYITHAAAKRLGLEGEEVTLIMQGVGEMTTTEDTKRYLLKIRVRTPAGEKAHRIVCYGLDRICKVHRTVNPQQLRKFFPEAEEEDLVRPDTIELLISIREGRLAPRPVKTVGDLVLWEGPLGTTVGGTHPDLFEEVEKCMLESNIYFARSMKTTVVKYKEIVKAPRKIKGTKASALAQVSGTDIRSTTTTNKEVLEWWKWDSIGAACEPRCGGCRCGKCQPGGKEMTLAEEKELEIIRGCLSYVTSDNHSSSPHWDSSYPWTEDPATLPNNRGSVEATFLKTEKRLAKQPEWREAYKGQVHEMVNRGAAMKLTQEMIDDWKGPVSYVSHLIAPNPHSVTTPVRLVWNSSQSFKGVSMNDLLLKGPDVLNPIRAVLLRFRKGEHAALGDIRKMYNSVWLKEQEVHLHRFLWRDNPEEKIEDYAITRVNIGDRPAGCIAQLAMRETAKLPQFSTLEEERRVLEEDSYVDDILTSHNDPEELEKITRGVEEILKAGGFALKPWVRSGQGGRSDDDVNTSEKEEPGTKPLTMVLPNQMKDEDNKALGIGYLVREDKLYMMTAVNFSRRKGKMRTGINLKEEEVREKTPIGLSRRELLSQVAGLYDPIGLVTPAKQKGAILVRRAFQEAGSGSASKDTWDDPLSAGLREDSIRLFEEYVKLGQVKFQRSLTPSEWRGEPWGITFSDGSDDAYGAVLYLRWETQHGVEVRLVESKAKLAPLDQKGDAVRAEVCGAVFATRLRKYLEKHGQLQIERWVHLVDSRTVLGAIQRESYGYQTFFANRIGEIQKAGPSTEWWWIPGELNVADAVTRGVPPEDLDEESSWQQGPKFLKEPMEEWPIQSAAEVAADVRESVNKLQRKAFSAVLTRAQSRKAQNGNQGTTDGGNQGTTDGGTDGDAADKSQVSGKEEGAGSDTPKSSLGRKPPSTPITDLIDPKRHSNLSKLCRVIAWVWRAAQKWLQKLSKKKNGKSPTHQNGRTEEVLSPREREDALRDLLLATQSNMSIPASTKNRLVAYQDEESGLLMCRGRAKAWNGEETAVPILLHDTWVSNLIAREAHKKGHENEAGTLLRMRKKAWIVKGRKAARKAVDECILCRKERARRCRQVMSDLPPERTTPAAPFAFTTLDLFGPFEVRDGKRRRVTLKAWGVVFSCMVSRAIHADVVEDQSTEGLLATYARFTALRGHPKRLWSDPGSNFVGARPVLQDLYTFLDKQNKTRLEEEAARNGTEWSWQFHPADSPHRNGAAEAAVKAVKRALRAIDEKGPFTLSEFQTLLYLAANLANERPIAAREQAQEDVVEYLSPNSLLLGRSGPKGDSEGFTWDYPLKRFRAVQEAVDTFWRRWSQLAGPNLFIRQKWHTKERNVAVGDLVWLADQNALRGQFRLGRVVQANSDPAGVVRDVQVKTVTSRPGSPEETTSGTRRASRRPPGITIHRDVRRLVVLLPVEEQGLFK